MQLSGRVSAAIEIVKDFEARKIPIKTAIADWGRQNRYAGAKDRAWISGLCLDVLRRRHSLARWMKTDEPRAAVLAALALFWEMPLEELEEICAEEPHGPGALSEEERASLSGKNDLEMQSILDVPEWVVPMIKRAFGKSYEDESGAFCQRADIDLRINSLQTQPAKAFAALKSVKGRAHSWLDNAARIQAPDPSKRAPSVTIIPAFNKGWVEVQDIGSRIATLAAGDIKGKQVLDFCAGAGGKTLALAALMENTGQLYAYDIDARRLKPLYARAKRAGLRNLQIVSPASRGEASEDTLKGQKGLMDVVFVDAPCSGSGTWRRHPDTKWRLSERQLETRMREQDQVLKNASLFVKPGGLLIYVTCSVFYEENEDRLSQFLTNNSDFKYQPVLDLVEQTGHLTQEGREGLTPWVTCDEALRLSPMRSNSDGFYISALQKNRL